MSDLGRKKRQEDRQLRDCVGGKRGEKKKEMSNGTRE